MDQYYNSSQNDFLWTLLANPANDARLYANNLQQLVKDFPQSGILQALLAHASDEKNLKQASVYFNPNLLYKLINSPSAFTSVSDEKIVIQPKIRGNGHYPQDENTTSSPDTNTAHDVDGNLNEQAEIEPNVDAQTQESGEHASTYEDTAPSLENNEEGHHFTEVIDEVPVEAPVEATATEEHASQPTEPEPEIAGNMTTASSIDDKVIDAYEAITSRLKSALEGHLIANNANDEPTEAVKETPQEQPIANAFSYPHIDGDENHKGNIDEAIYDEIVGIENIGIDQTANSQEAVEHNEAAPDKAQKLIESNSSDSNRFASNGSEPAEKAQSNEQQDLSKYHDEKMPYTFMWWLDKTRKEHAGVFRPYAKTESANQGNKGKGTNDELQQQYYENIFHITSVEELDKSTAPYAPSPKFNVKRKEQIIIQRFIEEEPQIKPQSSDKLDNENKAKKSSEDRDELVTETLAAIYSDQMLYHKAIASYKKLILKFPEKSRYFAGKIEQLEKKTN